MSASFLLLLAALVCVANSSRVCLPSRSQYGEEEAVIQRFFPGKRGGIYVEIGAYDGMRFSNTLKLDTCLDWTGTLVEGNLKIFHLLEENAEKTGRRASLWHGAVCTPPANETMFASRGTAVAGDLNQMDDVFKAKWANMHNADRNNPQAYVVVPCFPMSHFLKDVPHVDFFSLDVETAEFEVISTMDFTVTTVDLFMIEWPKTENQRTWKIRRALTNVGYIECPERVPFSRLFVHRRSGHLLDACCRKNQQCRADAAHMQEALVATEQAPHSWLGLLGGVVVLLVVSAFAYAVGERQGSASRGY